MADKDFTTSEMRDSPWLAAEDLLARPNQQITVTIEDVDFKQGVQFASGPKKDKVFYIQFKGAKRKLALTNSSNRNMLKDMFGHRTSGWIGKTIQLYLVKTKFQGKPVDGIRIRQAPTKKETNE